MTSLSATRHFLREIYSVSYHSGFPSVVVSHEQPGRGEASVSDLRLRLAIVKSTIYRVLVSDHLIETVNAVYSDNARSLFSAVRCLSASTGRGEGKVLDAIERYKLMTCDGIEDFEPENEDERKFSEWVDFSLEILCEEFSQKGWI